jgi:hypothetical protein
MPVERQLAGCWQECRHRCIGSRYTRYLTKTITSTSQSSVDSIISISSLGASPATSDRSKEDGFHVVHEVNIPSSSSSRVHVCMATVNRLASGTILNIGMSGVVRAKFAQASHMLIPIDCIVW